MIVVKEELQQLTQAIEGDILVATKVHQQPKDPCSAPTNKFPLTSQFTQTGHRNTSNQHSTPIKDISSLSSLDLSFLLL